MLNVSGVICAIVNFFSDCNIFYPWPCVIFLCKIGLTSTRGLVCCSLLVLSVDTELPLPLERLLRSLDGSMLEILP